MSQTTASATEESRVLPWLAITIAVVLQAVVLVPFTTASGLLAPLWAVVALHVLWVGFAIVLYRTARSTPLFSPLVPVVNAGLWFGLMTAGESLLGWTA